MTTSPLMISPLESVIDGASASSITYNAPSVQPGDYSCVFEIQPT